jgi:hypothetical protein
MTAERLVTARQEYLQHLWKNDRQTQYATDKMPGNYQRLGLISTLFPQSKIIYCRRDPMDNCFSIFQQRFSGNHAYAHDLVDLGKRYRAHEQVMRRWQAVIPNPVITVQYEDVVNDPEGQVRRLLNFLGLPYEPDCLHFHQSTRKVRTASRDQVNQPLYSHAIGKWKRYEAYLKPLIAALSE